MQLESETETARLLEVLTAHTPAQARLLLNLSCATVLGVVMAQAASASTVAAEAGVTLKQAHHRLTRLLEAGLIHVCAEQKRGGRAVKLYRAVARSFGVPFTLTEAADVEELLGTMHRPFMAAIVRHQARAVHQDRRDVRLRLDGAGQLMYDLGDRPALQDEIRPYGTTGTASLRPEDASYLLSECLRLSRWAADHHDPEGASYLLGLMFTPGQMEP
jgi:hypothetical protein